jgi:hypothetical protein
VKSRYALPLETLGPFVQMATLHWHETAHCRNRGSLRQEQNRPRSLGQSRGYTWPPQQSIELLALLGRHANNPLPGVLCHRNILVARELIFVSLISGL